MIAYLQIMVHNNKLQGYFLLIENDSTLNEHISNYTLKISLRVL